MQSKLRGVLLEIYSILKTWVSLVLLLNPTLKHLQHPRTTTSPKIKLHQSSRNRNERITNRLSNLGQRTCCHKEKHSICERGYYQVDWRKTGEWVSFRKGNVACAQRQTKQVRILWYCLYRFERADFSLVLFGMTAGKNTILYSRVAGYDSPTALRTTDADYSRRSFSDWQANSRTLSLFSSRWLSARCDMGEWEVSVTLAADWRFSNHSQPRKQDREQSILWVLDTCKWRGNYIVECESDFRWALTHPSSSA